MAWVTYLRSHSRDWETAQLPCLWSLCSKFCNCFLHHRAMLMSTGKRDHTAVAKPGRCGIEGGWKAGWTAGLGGEWLMSWSLAGGQGSVVFLSCQYWHLHQGPRQWDGRHLSGWCLAEGCSECAGDLTAMSERQAEEMAFGASAWGTGVEGISHLTIVPTCQKEGGWTLLRCS